MVELEIIAKGYSHSDTQYPFRRIEAFRKAERPGLRQN